MEDYLVMSGKLDGTGECDDIWIKKTTGLEERETNNGIIKRNKKRERNRDRERVFFGRLRI